MKRLYALIVTMLALALPAGADAYITEGATVYPNQNLCSNAHFAANNLRILVSGGATFSMYQYNWTFLWSAAPNWCCPDYRDMGGAGKTVIGCVQSIESFPIHVDFVWT